MSEVKRKSNLPSELTAKLYLALDDLTMTLATCDSEEIRKSEVFQKALEVVKVVKEMRKLQAKPELEKSEKNE